MQQIANHQQQDAELLLLHQTNPIQVPMQNINGVDVLTMRTEPNQPNLWKIYLPDTLVVNVIHWYHVTLGHVGHVGTQKLYDTISNRFMSPRLYSLCQEYVCPHNCAQWKQQGVGYSHLPACNALVAPWDEAAVNLIEPWKIQVDGKYLYTMP